MEQLSDIAAAVIFGMSGINGEDGNRTWVDESTREAYRVTDAAMVRLAEELLAADDDLVTIQTPNPHQDARWFPEAGLGLFLHWGIHSVAGAQPSWAMIKDYPYAGPVPLYPPDRYYALADQFDPQNFHPERWLRAAKEAGFEYAVLTAKHHDGYALWPSRYGNFSTAQYLDGRDLVGEYVEACRAVGLKVGLYFSPRDWRYPDFPVSPHGFDHNRRDERPTIDDPEANRRAGRSFFAFTIAQLHELLTRYGKIDLIWFDGMNDWNGGINTNSRAVYGWMRSLQPGLVINDRWDKVQDPDSTGGDVAFGDFSTHEIRHATTLPDGWWEHCDLWATGTWGYSREVRFEDTEWLIENLIRARKWGGNLLANVGPQPDGEMPPEFYTACRELQAWMSAHPFRLHEYRAETEGWRLS